jgi:hypothetical protein
VSATGEYAKENGTYGLTTLHTTHLDVESSKLRFHFKGKSGKTWRLRVKDCRVARIVRAIQDLPACRRGRPLSLRRLLGRERLFARNCWFGRVHQGFSHLGGHGACGHGS